MKLKRIGIWECKIGLCDGNALPSGADSPMRDAVAKAYKELTGQDPKFIFSGWDARLTSGESSAVDGIDVVDHVDELDGEWQGPIFPHDQEAG